jgi:hypothetical protein
MEIESDKTKHVDSKLIRRVRILVAILIVMTGILIYEVYISRIPAMLLILGIVSGVAIGFIAGRMFSIEWHVEKRKVIGRLDRLGIVVLVLYIAFSIARHFIFEYWLKGAVLSAFTISFVEGAMLGRILSMRLNIKRVLVDQGKI